MSIRRTLTISRNEFRHIIRDLRTLFLVTVSPAFLLLTLSYIFAFNVEQFDMAVWDLDGTALSREYVVALTADQDFQVRYHVDSYDNLDGLLLSGNATVGLIIPRGFEEGVRAGRPVQIQAVVDGSDPIAAGQAVRGLGQRTAVFSVELQPAYPNAANGLDLRSEIYFNPTLKALISMVPALGSIVLCMPALALALSLTREKETGSFEGLMTTPIRGIEYLLGKLIAYISSGLVSVLLVWLLAVFYFDVPFRGDLGIYFLLAADYLLASMGFSLLVGNFAHSQQTAMFLVLMVFFVPSFFVTGLIMPIDPNSLGSQLVAFVLPATHFITISRGIFLKGLSLGPLLRQAWILAMMGTGGLLASLLLFRKRMK